MMNKKPEQLFPYFFILNQSKNQMGAPCVGAKFRNRF